MLEVDLRGEQPAGPVRELQGQGAPQCLRGHRVGGDRGEPEAVPGRAVHPGAECLVAGLEAEAAAERGCPGRVIAEEGGGEPGGLVDGLDDDPFVGGAAERLAFDQQAGQPVADQPRLGLPGRDRGGDGQLHQYWWKGVTLPPPPGSRIRSIGQSRCWPSWAAWQASAPETLIAAVWSGVELEWLRNGTGWLRLDGVWLLPCPGWWVEGMFRCARCRPPSIGRSLLLMWRGLGIGAGPIRTRSRPGKVYTVRCVATRWMPESGSWA